MNEHDYAIALTEASWFTTYPPSVMSPGNVEEQSYVNRLIQTLTEYEEAHGLESYELRELKAQEDSK